MPDREKVIYDIERCICRVPDACRDCSHYQDDRLDCMEKLLADALVLLKEQEAKNVVNMTLSKDKFLIASCPKCNVLLTRVEHKNYCGYCGQAVKWE